MVGPILNQARYGVVIELEIMTKLQFCYCDGEDESLPLFVIANHEAGISVVVKLGWAGGIKSFAGWFA